MGWQSHVPREGTLPERQCEELLKELGLSYDSQYRLPGYAEYAPVLDFLVEGVLGIEVQGTYWHLKKRRVRKDADKKRAVEDQGLVLLSLWDHELAKASQKKAGETWRPFVKDLILISLAWARRVNQFYHEYRARLPEPPLILHPEYGAVRVDRRND